MFGGRYFGARYYGKRYFGPSDPNGIVSAVGMELEISLGEPSISGGATVFVSGVSLSASVGNVVTESGCIVSLSGIPLSVSAGNVRFFAWAPISEADAATWVSISETTSIWHEIH